MHPADFSKTLLVILIVVTASQRCIIQLSKDSSGIIWQILQTQQASATES